MEITVAAQCQGSCKNLFFVKVRVTLLDKKRKILKVENSPSGELPDGKHCRCGGEVKFYHWNLPSLFF